MKKIISSLLFSILVLAGATANAQFEKGDKIINVGIGAGMSSLSYSIAGYGSGFGINGSYEVGITDFISVGGQLDYLGHSNRGYKFNTVAPAARASYHFGKHFLTIDQLDLYGGVALGLAFNSSKWDLPILGSDKTTNTDFHFGLYAGARYYFSPQFGVFSEVGSNTAVFKAGVAFKL